MTTLEGAPAIWIGDPGSRDAPEASRATYVGLPKPFCPCDTGRPQDCKPEEWSGAHAPRPPCERCGWQLHGHQGNYCRRPTPWMLPFDDDWIWYALRHPEVAWHGRAVEVVRTALRRWAGVNR